MIWKCKKCRGPAPTGHDLCWFCEHDAKLHEDPKHGECEEDDACPIPELEDANGTEQRSESGSV